MLEGQPDTCPNGHPLRYPNVTVGWTPCPCRPRTDGRREPPGHETVQCRRCSWQWRKGGCDDVGEWHQLD